MRIHVYSLLDILERKNYFVSASICKTKHFLDHKFRKKNMYELWKFTTSSIFSQKQTYNFSKNIINKKEVLWKYINININNFHVHSVKETMAQYGFVLFDELGFSMGTIR
jgi:hypothetical protein